MTFVIYPSKSLALLYNISINKPIQVLNCSETTMFSTVSKCIVYVLHNNNNNNNNKKYSFYSFCYDHGVILLN